MPNIRRIYYSIIFIQIILTTYILINQDSNETLDTNQDYIRENENDQTLKVSCIPASDANKIQSDFNQSLIQCINNEWINITDNGVVLFNPIYDIDICYYSYTRWFRNDFTFYVNTYPQLIKNGSKVDTNNNYFTHAEPP